MSIKAVTWIIVLILAALGVWYFMNQSQPVAAVPQAQTATTTSAAQPAGTSVQAQTMLSSGTSDQNLNADLTQIDVQAQSANQGSAAVDQSFKDQSVQQSHL